MSVRSTARALRGPIVTLLVLAGLLGGAALVSVWWRGQEPDRDWVVAYGEWVHRVHTRLERELPVIDACDGFEEVDPPEQLTSQAERVHGACLELGRDQTDLEIAEWYEADTAFRRRLFWHRPLPRRGGIVEGTRIEPRLSELASDLSGWNVEVRCWSEDEWPDVEAAWQAFAGKPDFWLYGLAEAGVNRVHLAPAVCRPLARFVYGSYAPWGNEGIFRLAEAVATLTHEARHIKHPRASEAVVECYALQDMRALIASLGRPLAYANELVGLAFEISYPQLPPEYRTAKCRPGGSLDLTPRDRVFP